MAAAIADSPQKPLLRGVSHQVAFFIAVVGTVGLLFLATGSRDLWGAGIYGASLSVLFGTSALYHRIHWRPAARAWMRRLDHSAIFVLIAGTFTPLALHLASGGTLALSLIWGGALIGILQSLFWVHAPKALVAILAVALGWSMIPFLADLRALLGPVGISLVTAGGVLYSAGALVYAKKRPDPAPRVFCYHEVFHAMVVGAAICHFIAVALVLGSA